MRRGRPLKPLISIESVRIALKSLDYTAQNIPDTRSLENLLLVDFRLRNSARPSAEDIRAWMLRHILVEIILSGFNQYRRYFDLQMATLDSNRTITLKQIQTGFQTESEHLKGWSLLYARYVRPELNFSMQELAEQTHTHERSLRRYQETAIQDLRDRLIEAEWEIRKTEQSAYLRSLIPEQIVNLIGRDAELKSILTAFGGKFPHPVVISGANGVGKSALGATIAEYLIEQETIDYLLWIQNPRKISSITNRIWDTVLPYPAEQHWRETLQFQRLLLVVDGVEQIELDDWSNVLLDLQSSFVILINREKPVLRHVVQHIELDNLSRDETEELITTYSGDTNNLQQTLIDEIGGNPGKLLLGLQYVSVNTPGDKLESFYKQRFESLPDNMQIVHLLTLIHGTNLPRGIVKLMTDDVNVVDFDTSQGYTDYLQRRYHNEPDLRIKVQALIDTFPQNDAPDDFFLNIAGCGWLTLEDDSRLRLLQRINLHSALLGTVRRWRTIFETYYDSGDRLEQNKSELYYCYGVALRRTYAYGIAEPHLKDLAEQFGRIGRFELQMRCLFELALLYQAQGQLSRSEGLYHHVLSLLNNYRVADLQELIFMQIARSAIAQQDGTGALNHLQGLGLSRHEIYVLYCEARFLTEDYDFVLSSIPQRLKDLTMNSAYRASLYTILGRTYQQTGHLADAIVHFNEALSIVEQEAGQFDIARARNNLVSTYLMQLSELDTPIIDELKQMITEAIELQTQINDSIGLEASTRNLNYLLQHHRT